MGIVDKVFGRRSPEPGSPRKSAIAPLLHRDRDSRARAAQKLDESGWTPQDDTEKAYYLIAREEWDELVRLGPPAVDPLIRALRDDSYYVRGRVAMTLGRIRDGRALEPLLQTLERECKGMEDADARGYGLSGGLFMGTGAGLLERLDNPYFSARYVAEETLGGLAHMRDRRAVPYLLELPKYGAVRKDSGIWTALVRVLAKLGDRKAVPFIASLLREPAVSAQPAYRRLIADALGELGGEEAVSGLTQALEREKDEGVRASIQRALDWAKRRMTQE